MCWTCGCGHLEQRHDARALTTADMQAAANQAGADIPRVVQNIVGSLSHFNPALAKAEESAVASGTVLKADPAQRFVLMVLYSPNRMPHRGADHKIDVVSPDVLEKACWRFTDNGLKVGLFHEAGHDGAARCVENYIYRNPSPWVVKGPDGSEQVIKAGDWIGGFILDQPTWEMYKSGLIGGASPQGTAGRKPASPETLARIEGGSE